MENLTRLYYKGLGGLLGKNGGDRHSKCLEGKGGFNDSFPKGKRSQTWGGTAIAGQVFV